MHQGYKHRNGRELIMLVLSKAIFQRSCDSWISEYFTKQNLCLHGIIHPKISLEPGCSPMLCGDGERNLGTLCHFMFSSMWNGISAFLHYFCGKTIPKILRGRSDFLGKATYLQGRVHPHPLLPLLFRFGSFTVFLSCSGVRKVSLNFSFSEKCVIPASSAFMYLTQGSTDIVRKLLTPHILLNKSKCKIGCL